MRLFAAAALPVIFALFISVSVPARAAQVVSDDAYELLIQKYPNLLDEKSAEPEDVPQEEPSVVLPSRFSQAGNETSPVDDEETSMVAQWLAETGSQSPAAGLGQREFVQNSPRKNFMFGADQPRVVCRPGMLTDVELPPGERVVNFVVSDPDRWSVSAAWSGELDNLVTHVLLRTKFPGLKANLAIYTDKRSYSLEIVSSDGEEYMPYVGFNFVSEKEFAKEDIPTGQWRDLLDRYDLLPDYAKDREPEKDVPNLIDGADIYSHYVIKLQKGGRSKKIDWRPVSVYDANNKTYIVLPKSMKASPGLHTLLMKQGDNERAVTYRTLRNDLYVVDRVSDAWVLVLDGSRVEIVRREPIAER
jgi:type IV secretion system protein VirB9